MQNRSLHKIPSISRRFVAFIHTLEICNLCFDNCTCRFPLFFHNEDQKSARTYILLHGEMGGICGGGQLRSVKSCCTIPNGRGEEATDNKKCNALRRRDALHFTQIYIRCGEVLLNLVFLSPPVNDQSDRKSHK